MSASWGRRVMEAHHLPSGRMVVRGGLTMARSEVETIEH